MSRINLGRVALGGLLAGLIINIGEYVLNGILIFEQMNAAMAALNKPPIADSMIMWFVLFGFGLGFMWSGPTPPSVRDSAPASKPRSARHGSCGGLPISIQICS